MQIRWQTVRTQVKLCGIPYGSALFPKDYDLQGQQ